MFLASRKPSVAAPLPSLPAVPTPAWPTPAEAFAARTPPQPCVTDPAPTPGATVLRDYVLDRFGGTSLGITRPCSMRPGEKSHHKEGRAWDWGGIVPGGPKVTAMLEWLLANDAEIFRRAGLEYVIWDGQIFTSTRPQWRPYTGTSPHRDHVHFSLSPQAARGETSFYRANPLSVA